MCEGMDHELGFPNLLRDPPMRLMMERDGVTQQEMIDLMDVVHRAPGSA